MPMRRCMIWSRPVALLRSAFSRKSLSGGVGLAGIATGGLAGSGVLASAVARAVSRFRFVMFVSRVGMDRLEREAMVRSSTAS